MKPVPIIAQTIGILRQKISSGDYTHEGRMLSETDLAQELGVSRTTIRTALSRLEAEGVITRRHGAGTFVNRRATEISASLHHIWDFQHMIIDSGRTPSVKFLSYTSRIPTDEEIELFDIEPDVELLALERLFLADDTPVIFSTNLFPHKVLCSPSENVRFDLPIHKFLAYHCDQKIGYCINNLSAVEAPPGLEQFLHIQKSKPVLQFVNFFYNAQDEILVYGHNYYDDKVLSLRIVRSWG